jgi:hypothetical protein
MICFLIESIGRIRLWFLSAPVISRPERSAGCPGNPVAPVSNATRRPARFIFQSVFHNDASVEN